MWVGSSARQGLSDPTYNNGLIFALKLVVIMSEHLVVIVSIGSALDKVLGQLGIYTTWLSSIAYLQKQLHIFIFFLRHIFFL